MRILSSAELHHVLYRQSYSRARLLRPKPGLVLANRLYVVV